MRHEQLERMQTQLLDVQDTLAGKADISMVNECLALKANKESVASALHRKVRSVQRPAPNKRTGIAGASSDPTLQTVVKIQADYSLQSMW